VKGVLKYLNPSPATAKGHMRQPCKGIRSTWRNIPLVGETDTNPTSVTYSPLNAILIDDESIDSPPIAPRSTHTNLIEYNNKLEANFFCFATFANKYTGVLYSDLTGTFPFMSLKGNVCFLVVYHYKTNSVLALPIANFNDKSILATYCQQFELLESKGHKIKLNVMDNQASRVIKNFLTQNNCDLMLIEPNNHRVNAAK
jgi:hypothetical protein